MVTYIDGVAAPDVVEEVCKRIESINIDGVVESSYVDSISSVGVKGMPYIEFMIDIRNLSGNI